MLRKTKDIDRNFFLNHAILKKHIPLLHSIRENFQAEDRIFFIRAPGRVNLIGEHTDYNMGPVLPCAIDREIVFCLRANSSTEISMYNVDSKFEKFRFAWQKPISPYTKGHWGNYIKAGIKGILNYLKQTNYSEIKNLKGFDAIVSSTLPAAAGLSSSSALVVAAAIALLTINKIYMDKLMVADVSAEAEHFVGTAGGGMDQATCLLGEKDAFLKIEFNPLRVHPIAAPKNIALILFHSLVEAQKSHNVRQEYNRRVLECRMGVDLFNRFLADEKPDNYQKVNYIGEINTDKLFLHHSELADIIQRFLGKLKDCYSLKEIEDLLDSSKDQLSIRYQSIIKSDVLKEPSNGFRIKGRFRHVYTECTRVHNMIRCLQEKDITGMSALIKASHESLAHDYQVSTPEVEHLLNLLRELGLTGARLIGAGFGGMILALSKGSQKVRIIENMKQNFYTKKGIEEIDNYIIPCVTSDGAGEI